MTRLKKEFLSECTGDLLGRVFKDYLTNKGKTGEECLGEKKVKLDTGGEDAKLESVFDHST